MAVTASLKLRIYNEALRHLGSRKLVSVTENREPRRVMDDVWANGELAVYCLEQGSWNFAIRTVHASYSPSIEPDFGFERAYPKPDDFVRLEAMSTDAFFTAPLTNREYHDEAGHWFTDHDEIFIRYVSRDDDYGMDGGNWTGTFIKYVAAQMAWEACERITNSTSQMQKIDSILQRYKKDARSKDAMNEGIKFGPAGSWVRSRGGWFGRDRYRGE